MMDNKLEHMEMMHSMCQQEVLLLQRSVERFLVESENTRQLLANGDRLAETNGQNIYAVMAYDTYMSHLSAVTNMARKFNIQLQLHSLSKSVSRRSMVSCEFEIENVYKELKNINDTANFDIDCTAMHFECAYKKNPSAIESANGQVSRENDISPSIMNCDKMFAGCVLEDQEPDRRLRDLSCFEEGFEFRGIITCVESYKDLTFYISTMTGNVEIPSEAIKCVLFGFSSNINASHKYLVTALQQRILKETLFKVIYKEDRILYLEILDLCNDYTLLEMQPKYTDSNMFDVKSTVSRLPMKSSSAVEGMNPFYDDLFVEKTVAWKDIDKVHEINESNKIYLDSQVKSEDFSLPVPKKSEFKSGATVLISVTHIQSATSFYGQIETTESAEKSPVFWTDDNTRTKQKLLKPPEVGDLVLAQYPSDQLWYRAKVVSCDTPNQFTVFYVDYGNEEQVDIEYIAKYAKSYLDVDGQFRCVCCCLAGITDITVGDERRQNMAKQLLRANLIYQKFNATILQLGLDGVLVIRILDSEFADVPDILLQLGYVKKV